MRRPPAIVLAGLFLAGALAAGCEPEATSRDAEYLGGFCRSFDRFAGGVSLAGDETALRIALALLLSDLEAIDPPQDLGEYHLRLIRHVRAIAEDATRPETTDLPEPPPDARSRLSTLEQDLPECVEAIDFTRPR